MDSVPLLVTAAARCADDCHELPCSDDGMMVMVGLMITPLPDDTAATTGLPMGGLTAATGGELVRPADAATATEAAVAGCGDGCCSLAFCSCRSFHTFFTDPPAACLLLSVLEAAVARGADVTAWAAAGGEATGAVMEVVGSAGAAGCLLGCRCCG